MLNLTFSSTIRAMNPCGNPYGRRTNERYIHKANNRRPAQSVQEELGADSAPGGSEAPIALKIRLRVPHRIEPHMVLPRGTILLGDLYSDNKVVIRGTQNVILASSEWDVVFDDLVAYDHFAQWAQGS